MPSSSKAAANNLGQKSTKCRKLPVKIFSITDKHSLAISLPKLYAIEFQFLELHTELVFFNFRTGSLCTNEK